MHKRISEMRKKSKLMTEQRYNDLPDNTKDEIGFPTNYLYLTIEQERFILDLLDGHKKTIKTELLDMMDEMKELVDEI
tara:strand:+ start:206 stop:439 length:234 start_codon:yes stop_codon:yes gene_type:complete